MNLSKKQRIELKALFGGKCAYCGIQLPEKGWHADHVKPVNRELKFERDRNGFTKMVPTGKLYSPENDCLENLMPACAPCNIDKSSMELEDWRHWLNHRITISLRENSSTFRHAERFGRVVLTPGPLVFWFEKFVPS